MSNELIDLCLDSELFHEWFRDTDVNEIDLEDYYQNFERPRSPTPVRRRNFCYELEDAIELREKLAHVMNSCVDYAEHGCEIDMRDILLPLLSDHDEVGLWEAVMYRESSSQDTPIIEAAKRDLHQLVSFFFDFVLLSVLERDKKVLLEYRCSQHGRTALQHAVRRKHWKTANVLIKNGADIGYLGCRMHIIENILKAAKQLNDEKKNSDASFVCGVRVHKTTAEDRDRLENARQRRKSSSSSKEHARRMSRSKKPERDINEANKDLCIVLETLSERYGLHWATDRHPRREVNPSVSPGRRSIKSV